MSYLYVPKTERYAPAQKSSGQNFQDSIWKDAMPE